jgi:hypothetical protein
MSLVGWAWGQQASSNSGTVPTVIRFSGNLADANGKSASGMVGVTFSLYKDEQGGAALWVETQNVKADKSGHYAVTLGSTTSQGLPTDLFATGEARWLGVQPQGLVEQPRVLLMSVPYALKAADAETLGGKPASAFLVASGTATNSDSRGGSAPTLSGKGKPGYVALWKTSNSLTFAKLFQSTGGNIGIGTAKPAANFDVNGTEDVRNTLTLFPNGSAPTLTVNGTTFNVSNTGLLSFVSGQTFPGTGTITGVTTASGSGLIGGGTSGNLNLALTNTCSANQVLQWTGSTWVCTTISGGGTITGVTAGTDLTGGGTSGNVTLNLDITKVPQLGTANVFAGTQTVGSGDLAINVGNLDLPQTVGGNVGVITVGGATFIHACCANSAGNTSVGLSAGAFNGGSQNNTATGYQVLGNTVGTNNTGSGYQALGADGKGSSNTAVGYQALYQNTTGNLNTAVGNKAGYTNTTVGSNNTLVGASADVGSDGLTNATAIGANAQVTTNNALVLGSIAGVNNATASANVGIGTTAPASALDVHGTGNFTGLITFAPNQTFPGAGTITGVNTPAGSGLTGGGTSGTLNLGLLNSCSNGQVLTWNGSAWVCSTISGGGTITGVTAGTDLTGGGTSGNVTLNLDTSKVPQLATANNFAAKQTISSGDLVLGNGSIDLPDTNGGGAGVITLGGFTFAHACCPSTHGNTYVGVSAGTFANSVLQNTAEGYQALSSNTGNDNTATGAYALNSNASGNNNTASGAVALYLNTLGSNNTASGYEALYSNTGDSFGNGSTNTASGAYALYSNIFGNSNTASGYQALYNNIVSNNTAAGYQALYSNAVGGNNTASGYEALYSNTGDSDGNGSRNTASGAYALYSNIAGNSNTASGYQALYNNTVSNNTAAGYQALYSNTVGLENTASGYGALSSNTSGNENTASGFVALYSNTTGQFNTASGRGALSSNTTGSDNTALGYLAGVGSGGLTNATAIGANALVSASNALVLGAKANVGIATSAPTNIFTIGQGAGHAIADGWDTYSSRRWKTNIHTLHGALAKVEQLRGVSYDLKASGTHEVGVIAEEVGEVVPEIVSWDKNGKDAQGVDYSRLTALLIEATKEQQVLIHKQQGQIKAQQAQIKAQQEQSRLQNARIARLISQVNAIQATLKTNSGTDAGVRTAAVQVPAAVK